MTAQLPSGHTAKEIPPEEKEELVKYFKGFRKVYEENECMMRFSPEGWILPSTFLKYSQKIYDLKFNSGDILVMSHNKAGTHWMSEVAWTMIFNPNLCNPDAHISSRERVPFLDMDLMFPEKFLNCGNPFLEDFKRVCPGKDEKDGVTLQIFESRPGRRIYHTHVPISLYNKNLLDNCKVIYVVRNPKDIVVSFFNHCRMMELRGFVGNFEQFFDFFIEDKIMYGPYLSHVKAAWALKDHPNMHLLFFEDLKKNTKEEYTKINNFLQTNLSSSDIDKIVEYTRFPAMKQRDENDLFFKKNFLNQELLKSGQSFFRQGESGSWKTELTPEQEAKMDLWIQKNTEGTGLHFH